MCWLKFGYKNKNVFSNYYDWWSNKLVKHCIYFIFNNVFSIFLCAAFPLTFAAHGMQQFKVIHSHL